MCYKIFFVILLVIGSLTTYIQGHPNYIDLTHRFKTDQPRWPGIKRPVLTSLAKGLADLGGDSKVYVEMNEFYTPEHSGTHMDAPAHFTKGGRHAADFKVDELIGPGIKIDISSRASKNLDTSCSIKDLLDWEEMHGTIPDHAIVLLYTGQSKYWDDENKYYGRAQDALQNDTGIHFPGFSPEAAQWLVNDRNIVGVGVDTPSLDSGKEGQFPTHQILLGAGKWGVEHVANMDKLPENGYIIHNMVFKLHDGSGAPTRIYATFGQFNLSEAHVVLSSVYTVIFSLIATLLLR